MHTMVFLCVFSNISQLLKIEKGGGDTYFEVFLYLISFNIFLLMLFGRLKINLLSGCKFDKPRKMNVIFGVYIRQSFFL